MPYTSEATRARAEKHFKAQQRLKADAPQAVLDYRAQQAATTERMHRLRAERLAREATARSSEAPEPSFNSAG